MPRRLPVLNRPYEAVLLSLLLLGPAPALAQMVGPPQPMAPPSAASQNPIKNAKEGFLKLFKPEATPAPSSPRPAGASGFQAGSMTGAASRPAPAPSRPPLLSAPPEPQVRIAPPVASVDKPPPKKLITLDSPTNPLGFADAQSKLDDVVILVDKKQYAQAQAMLNPLRQWLIEATEAHISLYKTLDNVPSARAQAELEKQIALQFALLRDKALYEASRIRIAERDYRTAVKDLTEIIKSQPRSEMGLKSYRMLQDIGFTERLQLTTD